MYLAKDQSTKLRLSLIFFFKFFFSYHGHLQLKIIIIGFQKHDSIKNTNGLTTTLKTRK